MLFPSLQSFASFILTVVDAVASLVPLWLKAREASGESCAGMTATAFRFTASKTCTSPLYSDTVRER